MADEGGMQNSHIAKEPANADFVGGKTVWLKALEVVLAVLAVGLVVDPFDSFHQIFLHEPKPKLDDIAIIYVAVPGFIVINTIIIIGHLLGDRMPKRTSLLFTATGMILHVVAGAVMISIWRRLHSHYSIVYNNNVFASKQYSDMLISSSVFTLVDALIFGADLFFTIKYF